MKELLIPIGIDAHNATQSLHALGNEGERQTAKVAGGADHITDSFATAAKGVGAFIGITSALDVVNLAAHAVGDAFKDAADYIIKTSEEFIKFQQHLRESASLTGKMPTKEYTIQQLDLASKGRILTADEYASGLDAFNRFGSQFLSDEGEKASGMVSQETINEILPEIMGVAKAKNIDQATAGKALASIIAKMPKGTTAAQYKQEFMKLMGPAEFTSGSAQVTWDQLATIAMPYVGRGTIFGEGAAGLEKAEEFMGVIQQARPTEAATYTRDALKMLKDMRQKGEYKALGVTDEEAQDPNKVVDAIGRAWRKSGQNWEDFIQPHMHGRTAIQGQEAIQAAILAREKEGGALGRKIREKMAEGAKVKTDEYLKSYVASGEGAEDLESEARIDIARKRGGAIDSAALAAKKRTEAEMEEKGDFRGVNTIGFGERATWYLRRLDTSKNPRERRIQLQTLKRLAAEAQVARHKAGLDTGTVTKEIGDFWYSKRTMEQEFTRLIEMTNEANKIREKQVAIAENRGRPALSAPPPASGSRETTVSASW